VPVSQFGERQFELAANLELLAGSGSFFAPTTSLEAHLAIDVAMTPGDPRVWSLLGVPPPRGAKMGSTIFRHWPVDAPEGASPPFLVSLFVQYKRSTHLTRATAAEWAVHNSPYWRVELSARQHRRLQEVESAVGPEAAVRYAAPKFWKHEEMWQYQGAGGITDNSLFVSPGAVGSRHERLTWSPVRGLVGHSEAEPLPVEGPADLARDLTRLARDPRRRRDRSMDPRGHLASLAGALEELTPSGRRRAQWEEALRAEPYVDAQVESYETLGPLAEMAVVAEAASAARASWILLAVSEASSPAPGA
jgi:hypothetical protein